MLRKPTINQALYDVALETRPWPLWEISAAEGFYFRGCHSFILQSCQSLVAVFYARNGAVTNVLTFAHTMQDTWDSTQMPVKGYLGLLFVTCCQLFPEGLH